MFALQIRVGGEMGDSVLLHRCKASPLHGEKPQSNSSAEYFKYRRMRCEHPAGE